MSQLFGKGAGVPGREEELFELISPDDPKDRAYPQVLCALENQLLAGRYIDDELIEQWLAVSAKLEKRGPYRPEELPPVLCRYLKHCRNGVRNSHMRVNGRKLRAYTTAKRDDLITKLLGGAAELQSREGKPNSFAKGTWLADARKDAAKMLDLQPKTVQRRWAELNPDKPGRGRPRKKTS